MQWCCTGEASSTTELIDVSATPAIDGESNSRRLQKEATSEETPRDADQAPAKAEAAPTATPSTASSNGSAPAAAAAAVPASKGAPVAAAPAEAAAAAPAARAPAEVVKSETPNGNEIADFTARIQKSDASQSIGMTLSRDTSGTMLAVQAVLNNSTVAAWNVANKEKAIKGGDEIVAVNGVTGKIDDMIAAMKAIEVELRLRRITKMLVSMPKNGSLGLRIDPDTLTVMSMLPGAIKKHNETVKATEHIRVGDKVVEANGEKGLAGILKALEEVKDGETMKLVLQRS